MALFKKKKNVPTKSPQQILVEQFPRTANSLLQRIHILNSQTTHSDTAILGHTQDIQILEDSLKKSIRDLEKELISVKDRLNQINNITENLLKNASHTVPRSKFQQLSKRIEMYDFSKYITRFRLNRNLQQ